MICLPRAIAFVILGDRALEQSLCRVRCTSTHPTILAFCIETNLKIEDCMLTAIANRKSKFMQSTCAM